MHILDTIFFCLMSSLHLDCVKTPRYVCERISPCFPTQKGERKKPNDKKIYKTRSQNRINIQFEYISSVTAELKSSTETVMRSLCAGPTAVSKRNTSFYMNSVTSKVSEQLYRQSSDSVLVVFCRCVCRLPIQSDVRYILIYRNVNRLHE